MSVTRAKFRCFNVEDQGEGTSIKKIGTCCRRESRKNENFFKWTPYGSIEIGTINPNVKFEEGQEYYVDFVKAD